MLVVPLLVFSLVCMVVTLPRILGTAWASAGKQSTLLGRAWSDADLLEVIARGLAVIAVVFPILAIGDRAVPARAPRGDAHLGRDPRPPRPPRALPRLLALALVAGLAYAWWPREGAYRPIQPYEGGTLTQVAAGDPATHRRAQRRRLRPDHDRVGRRVTPRPTRDKPQLALVLVPRDGSDRRGVGSATATGAGSGATPESWVFPFNKPLEPGKGDNQALAVNTTDNTIRYDVAFALVWIEDDSPALNKNEAYAFASCTNCAAVAIGFQVVLVTGENHVAVPQNISAAVNYDCVNCLTYALATQLFVTLDGPLSEASTRELNELWREIAAFGTNIATVPLNEIRDRLTEFEGQILDIIEADEASRGDDSCYRRKRRRG